MAGRIDMRQEREQAKDRQDRYEIEQVQDKKEGGELL